MASELRVNTLKDAAGANSVGMAYVAGGSAKMHCVVDQTSTQSITGSFNLSSITDNGAGKTSMTMTSAMSDATYTISGTGRVTGGNACIHDEDSGVTKTASVFGVYFIRQDGGVSDTTAQSVVHGDLA